MVLIAVPEGFDGKNAIVSYIGNDIGGRTARNCNNGKIAAKWDEMKRTLAWNLEDLSSGAVYEFQALFPHGVALDRGLASGGNKLKFPVMVRYESEGSLLSGIEVDLDVESEGLVKQQFRVYHREI